MELASLSKFTQSSDSLVGWLCCLSLAAKGPVNDNERTELFFAVRSVHRLLWLLEGIIFQSSPGYMIIRWDLNFYRVLQASKGHWWALLHYRKGTKVS